MFNINKNFCRWLDSNRGPLASEATTLPTEPQPLPKLLSLCQNKIIMQHLYGNILSFWPICVSIPSTKQLHAQVDLLVGFVQEEVYKLIVIFSRCRQQKDTFRCSTGSQRTRIVTQIVSVKDMDIDPKIFKIIFIYFQCLFHNSHDKFDRQILVLNQINQIEMIDVKLGSDKVRIDQIDSGNCFRVAQLC